MVFLYIPINSLYGLTSNLHTAHCSAHLAGDPFGAVVTFDSLHSQFGKRGQFLRTLKSRYFGGWAQDFWQKKNSAHENHRYAHKASHGHEQWFDHNFLARWYSQQLFALQWFQSCAIRVFDVVFIHP